METNNIQDFQSINSFIMNCADIYVCKRGFFAALFSSKYKLTYKKTGASLILHSETYAMVDADEITRVIENGKKDKSSHFKPSTNGNVMVNIYYSSDRKIALAQVERFMGFGYQPTTSVTVVKDDQADELLNLFI